MDCVRWFSFGSLALFSAANGAAAAPRVHFDMPLVVACRDVMSPQFAAANPSHRLVEARLAISTLLLEGKERDLTQLLIRIDSPQRTLTVVDYLPKTLHESRLAGPIGITKTDEKSASIGINLAGKYEPLTTIGGNAGLGRKDTDCVKYDLLPPLETVAASGTLLRGAGVFFKLKGSPRRPLEGASELALVLRVPRDWRTDYLRIHCEAEGIARGLVDSLDQTVSAGQRRCVVALHLEGDEAARKSAEELAARWASPAPAAVETSPEKPRSSGKPGVLPTWRLPKLL